MATIHLGKIKLCLICNKQAAEIGVSVINIGWLYAVTKEKNGFSGYKKRGVMVQITSRNNHLSVGITKRSQIIQKVA